MLQGPNAAAEALLSYFEARLRLKVRARQAGVDGATPAELAQDCFVSVLERWPALEAVVREGGNLGGYLARTIENWWNDRMRARDPYGAAASRRWRESIDAQVEAGVCERIAPRTGLSGMTVRILGVSPGRMLDGVPACAMVVDGFAELAQLRKELTRIKGRVETKALKAFWSHLKANRVAGFEASEMLAALRGEFRHLALDDVSEPAAAVPPSSDESLDAVAVRERALRRIATAAIAEAKKVLLAEVFRRAVAEAAVGEVDLAAVFASLGVVDRRRQHEHKVLLRSILGPLYPEQIEAGADTSGDRPSGDSGGVDD